MPSWGETAMTLIAPVNALVSRVASSFGGGPIRVALHPRAGDLLRGRLASVRAAASDVDVAGVRLREVEITASRVMLVPSIPPRLRARRIDVAAHLDQRAVDAWTRALGLPARLVIRPSRLVARIGVGGLRLGQIDMDVSVTNGGIRLSPRRMATLGFDLRTEGELDVVLPMPSLPSNAVVTDVKWQDGTGTVALRVDDFDVPLHWSDVRAARALVDDLLRRPSDRSLRPVTG
jgi:hypothetical protein